MTGKYPYNAFLRQLHSSKVAGQQGQPRQLLSANQAVVLGRDPSCEIVLDATVYEGVSRRHAEVRPLPGVQSQGVPVWQICDLNSGNGTYVNGRRLHGCQTLQVGDRIRLALNGPEFIFECQVNTPVVHAPRALPLQQIDSVHVSQLLPIFSTRRDLRRKGFLIPGIITVVTVVAMFYTLKSDNLQGFLWLLGLYLAWGAFYFIYQLCGKPKPWWLLIAAAVVTYMILDSPIMELLTYAFGLPGYAFSGLSLHDLGKHRQGTSLSALFIAFFFNAGLREELTKALPVIGAYLIGRKLSSPWRERIGVWEPLDGILLGAASSVGFTLNETLTEYVPNIIHRAGEAAGIALLIPRVLGEIAGHMAWSGYFGYFIGLSVLNSRKAWQYLGIGYLTSALLHALWDTLADNDLVGVIIAVVSYAFLMAAILKARKLSPNRAQNFATQMGGPPNFP